MSQKASPEVTQAILEVVENQLRDNNPPETRATLDRLQSQAMSRPEAVRLIACVVADEMFHVLRHGAVFDEKRFVANLKRLPAMPWDEPSS